MTQPTSWNSYQSSDGQPLQEEMQQPLTLAGSQVVVDQWIQSLGVRYFSELTNLAQLMEEVGELSRVISRSYGEQSFKPAEQPSDLSDELADVLFVLICLANQCGVDLEQALRRNLKKKTDRDSTRHKGNPKLVGTLKSNRNSEQSGSAATDAAGPS